MDLVLKGGFVITGDWWIMQLGNSNPSISGLLIAGEWWKMRIYSTFKICVWIGCFREQYEKLGDYAPP